VWNVRENVRMALRQKPSMFTRLSDVLAHINSRMDIPIQTWTRHSGILRDFLYQRRIEDYD
ncbi:MAG: hypothetical protein FJ151_03395, partial [Euryarchaeota archaeon]|nr:hypothetical protein [Euryarchaeota archaeon]